MLLSFILFEIKKSVTTMTTVGFGDIVPVNNDEKIFAIFMMLLSCGVFAYTMNTMGTVL